MEFAKLIVYQARTRENEPAIAFVGGVATYGMLARVVLAAADAISRTGLKRGALVAIDVRNPVHHVALFIALGLQGMVSASVQTAFSVEQTGLTPDAILIDGFAKHPPGIRQVPVVEEWFAIDPGAPVDYGRLMALPGFPDTTAVARIVFSSGTTGVPKSTGFSYDVLGQRLLHATFAHSADGSGSVMCMMGFSTLGGYLAALGTLGAGGLLCFGNSPAEALHIMRMFNVDMLIVAVFQLQMLLRALGDARPPPSLRAMIVGGSKIPSPLLADAMARLCPNLHFGYGSTEAGSIAYAPGSALHAIEGAAGYVLPWVTLDVVDDEDRPLPNGTEGIFRVKSDETARYVVDHPDNRLLFRDDWFYPGDIGTVRPDGLVIVTGRTAEVINRGGSIVAPDLVERVLLMRPEIKEAAAFGVPGKTGIDEIWAMVVTGGAFSEPEVLAFCREKLSDKAPDVVRRIEAIPRAESGKIQRKRLRDEVLRARASA